MSLSEFAFRNRASKDLKTEVLMPKVCYSCDTADRLK